jgi:hypothetical protein
MAKVLQDLRARVHRGRRGRRRPAAAARRQAPRGRRTHAKPTQLTALEQRSYVVQLAPRS